MDAWQNGFFRKMDNHLVHMKPNRHPPKMEVLPKNILQIILAAKWLVRYSSTSPKTAATTFAFSSVCFFFYNIKVCILVKDENICPLRISPGIISAIFFIYENSKNVVFVLYLGFNRKLIKLSQGRNHHLFS